MLLLPHINTAATTHSWNNMIKSRANITFFFFSFYSLCIGKMTHRVLFQVGSAIALTRRMRAQCWVLLFLLLFNGWCWIVHKIAYYNSYVRCPVAVVASKAVYIITLHHLDTCFHKTFMIILVEMCFYGHFLLFALFQCRPTLF